MFVNKIELLSIATIERSQITKNVLVYAVTILGKNGIRYHICRNSEGFGEEISLGWSILPKSKLPGGNF